MAILIVDDSTASRELLARLLRQSGFPETLTTASAREALHTLGQHAHRGRASTAIDAIVMDISMPEMDGIEACRRIRQDAPLQDIPIIMVTGRHDEYDIERALAAGASDYVTKPVKPVELLARLRAAIALRQEMTRRKERERQLLQVTRALEKANRRLQWLSARDGLTDIPNRRAFDIFLSRAWRYCARRSSPLALLMIDVDHFKAYNDAVGHLQGDACLRRVAQALQNALQRPGDFVARYGGEEFAAVLLDTDVEGALVVAESMRRAIHLLRIPHACSAVAGTVTVSIGMAGAVPLPPLSEASLLEATDQALYHAKRAGRNCVYSAGVLPAGVPTRQCPFPSQTGAMSREKSSAVCSATGTCGIGGNRSSN